MLAMDHAMNMRFIRSSPAPSMLIAHLPPCLRYGWLAREKRLAPLTTGALVMDWARRNALYRDGGAVK